MSSPGCGNGAVEMGDLIIRSDGVAGHLLEGMVRTHERIRQLAKRVRDPLAHRPA
jgi:hypothetical protein